MNYESANKIIENGEADFCSFGQLYTCNDNLAEKFRTGGTVNHFGNVKDFSKLFPVYLYGNTNEGYLDLSPYEA